MSLGDFATNVRWFYRNGSPWSATLATARALWAGGIGKVPVPPHGEHIYAREWDVLVVLDACRPDVLEALAPEYDFLPDSVPVIWSRGSQSLEWLRSTFTPGFEGEIARTTMVTGNVYSRELGERIPIEESAFERVDEVWRDGWDDDLGTVPPRETTDRAIAASREGSDRLIAHYMQPHAPYRSLEAVDRVGIDDGELGHRTTVWDLLQLGVISRDEVRAAYRDQLRWVLDDVRLLLESVDGDVAITADHGELFGEYGLHSHPPVPVPELRRVPWVETTARDTGAYEPTRATGSEDEISVTDRLASLGYR